MNRPNVATATRVATQDRSDIDLKSVTVRNAAWNAARNTLLGETWVHTQAICITLDVAASHWSLATEDGP